MAGFIACFFSKQYYWTLRCEQPGSGCCGRLLSLCLLCMAHNDVVFCCCWNFKGSLAASQLLSLLSQIRKRHSVFLVHVCSFSVHSLCEHRKRFCVSAQLLVCFLSLFVPHLASHSMLTEQPAHLLVNVQHIRRERQRHTHGAQSCSSVSFRLDLSVFPLPSSLIF